MDKPAASFAGGAFLLACLLVGLVGAAEAPTPRSDADKAKLAERDGHYTEFIKQARAGRLKEAITELQEVLALEHELFGDVSEEVVRSTDILAHVQEDAGDFPAARKTADKVLEISTRLYGKDDWRVTDARLYLEDVGRRARMSADERQRWRLLLDLDRQADELGRQGRPREALPVAEKALSGRRQLLGDEHREVANALNTLAMIHHDLGEHDLARPLYQEALDLRKKILGENHPSCADSLNNLALLDQNSGKYPEALTYFQQALSLYENLLGAKNPKYLQCLNNLALLYQDLGDHAEALPLFEKALEVRKQVLGEDSLDYAQSLHNLGYCHYLRGDYVRALPLYQQAYDIRRARLGEDHPDCAYSLNNLADLYQDTGEYAKALPLLRRACDLRKKAFGETNLLYAVTLNNLAFLYEHMGDYDQALSLFEEVNRLHKKNFGERHPLYATSLQNLARMYQRKRDYDKALEFLRRVRDLRKDVLGEAHPDYSDSVDALAQLYQEMGRYDEALPLFERACALRKGWGEGHPLYARSLYHLGGLYHVWGKPEKARECYEQSLAVYQELVDVVAASGSEAEALNFVASLPDVQNRLLSVTRDRPETADAIYRRLWQGKASVTRILSRRQEAFGADDDPKVRQAWDDLLAKRREIARDLLRPSEGGPAQREALQKLTEDKERLERQLARALPEFRRDQLMVRQRPEDLLEKLPPGVAFIDFTLYQQSDPAKAAADGLGEKAVPCYVAFVLAHDHQVARVELGPAKPIDDALASWRRRLGAAADDDRGVRIHEGPAARAEDDAAPRLRKLLWSPLAEQLPANIHVVYLAPDAALTRLPWAALPGRKEETVLLEEYALAVVPNGPFLLDHLTASGDEAGAAGTLLEVGDVSYGGAPAAAAAVPADGARAAVRGAEEVSWPALPGTGKELDLISGLAGERTVLTRKGTAATTQQILADLPRANWVHLATHGFFADAGFRSALRLDDRVFQQPGGGERAMPGARNPLVLSGVVLAGANRPEAGPDGGVLSAEAIAGMPLRKVRLAVLSACETGLGEVAGGEGVFGLQRAFHLAGAGNVVASLWKVDDEATAALMGLFYYKMWHDKEPPLDALRDAQLTLYRNPSRISALAKGEWPDFKDPSGPPDGEKGRRAAPRLWAGFVLSGTGR